MLKQLLGLYQKFSNEEAWIAKKVEQCPYNIKWKQIQNDIKNAKTYNDFMAIQKIHVDLQWLVSIREFDYNNEVIEIRKNENFAYWANKPMYELHKGLDSKKINNTIYLRYKQNDLVAPSVFDLKNEKHKSFVFDIASDFETIVRQTKVDGLAIEEKNLSLPKQFIYNALTFFSIFCTYEKHYIDPDYALELRDTLEKFK
jgi:hypothetical protein